MSRCAVIEWKFGWFGQFSAADGEKGGGKTTPQNKTLLGRRPGWPVISIAALGIGWEDQYTSLYNEVTTVDTLAFQNAND